MKKLLMTTLAVLAISAFASPTFAGQGEPNDHSNGHADGAGHQGAGNAHGGNENASDRAGAGGDNSGDNAHGGNENANDRAGAGGDNRGGHGE